jgi:hypothetical protein
MSEILDELLELDADARSALAIDPQIREALEKAGLLEIVESGAALDPELVADSFGSSYWRRTDLDPFTVAHRLIGTKVMVAGQPGNVYITSTTGWKYLPNGRDEETAGLSVGSTFAFKLGYSRAPTVPGMPTEWLTKLGIAVPSARFPQGLVIVEGVYEPKLGPKGTHHRKTAPGLFKALGLKHDMEPGEQFEVPARRVLIERPSLIDLSKVKGPTQIGGKPLTQAGVYKVNLGVLKRAYSL